MKEYDEAREKMANLLDANIAKTYPEVPLTLRTAIVKTWADQILNLLNKLGYRKLPKDRAPLLSDEEAK